ncbi:hypothetical protein Q4488_05320 [Amphritea sp. 1_MG-2023]|uniref:hypothetical protein n=1 Tax=Amphritea sp. 1_MG-2023 TaxID=3062670 RepID=UPI0026E26EB9|nr:hypothetical protein [Amphritea sp. 1_MG-2023]MDO6562800.1 hypothetical protein [Amphritea sp. 1_MG-2023]
MKKTLSLLAVSLGLILSTTAFSAPERHGPPQEAIEACASADKGDSCSFSGREGEKLKGVCDKRGDEQLSCAPENPPKRQ